MNALPFTKTCSLTKVLSKTRFLAQQWTESTLPERRANLYNLKERSIKKEVHP